MTAKVVFGLTCLLTQNAIANCNANFDDSKLALWLEQHERGLILIVSDGMPYSQKSVETVIEEARKRKLAVMTISDRSGKRQAERCDPILASSRLISKGALRHFPTLFTVKKHSLQPKVIPGIQTPKELAWSLDEIFR